jgi:hypothetical protein
MIIRKRRMTAHGSTVNKLSIRGWVSYWQTFGQLLRMRLMLQLSRSLSQFETQDIKTQPTGSQRKK